MAISARCSNFSSNKLATYAKKLPKNGFKKPIEA